MNFIDAVRSAIQFEKELTDFYLKASEDVEDSSGKSILEKLSQEEGMHYSYLKKKEMEWEKTGTVKLHDIGEIKRMDIKIKADMTDFKIAFDERENDFRMEILAKAYENEKKTYEFYKDMKGRFTLENEKKLFEEFFFMEEEHLMIVRAEIDSIMNNGFWYNFFESDVED